MIDSWLNGPRGILAQAERGREATRVSWPSMAHERGMAWVRRREQRPTCQRVGGRWRQGGERTIRPGRRTGHRRVRRRFFAVGPVPGGQGDGLARARGGGHGGGVDFTSGLEETDHGGVAGLSRRCGHWRGLRVLLGVGCGALCSWRCGEVSDLA
jgi:hypothetical protein